MPTRTNEEWLRALSQPGESQTEALRELRDYLLRAVLVYLRHHRSDLEDFTLAEVRAFAEDMAQEALLSIQNGLDSFRGDSKFTTWAYRFVINRAASELRLQRYNTLSLDRLVEQEEAAFTRLMRDQEGLDPELAAERHSVIALLRDIIRSQLTERQRLAIVGVHLQGLSMDEVADQLDTSRNALYKLLHDARKKIKTQLEERHLSEGDVLALFESYW